MRKKVIFVSIVPLAVIIAAGLWYRSMGGPSRTSAHEPKACADGCTQDKPAAAEAEHEEHEGHEAEARGDSNAGHDEHEGEAAHAGHAHGEEKVVVLTASQLNKFGVEVGATGPGKLKMHLDLPGEVTVNADRVAHIVPRVPGVVREVRKNLGDGVKKGEILAVLESRDLADAKAGFLAAQERLTMAKMNLAREEQLWKKRISAEQEYLQAKQAMAEASIELRSAEQKLHALGFSETYLASLPQQAHADFTRYELAAPFDGTIIEKHMTLGEAVKDDSEVFTIADLGTVWVTFNVHQKDLAMVRAGQPVTISAGHGLPDAQGTIAYVAPVVGEQTRTTAVRVVLANPRGEWRPGLFVTGHVLVGDTDVPVLVPKDAVLTIDGKPSVFVKTDEGFEPRAVTVGRSNDTSTEITGGLAAGQAYAAKGAYTLKLELSKFKGDPCGGH